MSDATLNMQSMVTKTFAGRQFASMIVWSIGLGLVSGLACVGVRFVFRVMQIVLVRRSGLLPHAAASLPPLHRMAIPIVGALLATGVLWLARRFASRDYEGYVEAVRFRHGHIPLVSTHGERLPPPSRSRRSASFMAVELTGQWHLLPLLVMLGFTASYLAHRISPHSLYEIATPSPTTS